MCKWFFFIVGSVFLVQTDVQILLVDKSTPYRILPQAGWVESARPCVVLGNARK